MARKTDRCFLREGDAFLDNIFGIYSVLQEDSDDIVFSPWLAGL